MPDNIDSRHGENDGTPGHRDESTPVEANEDGNADPHQRIDSGASKLSAGSGQDNVAGTLDFDQSAGFGPEIASICSKFQHDSSAEPFPTIEDYIPLNISSAARSKLVEMLVQIELLALRQKNQSIDPIRYLSRFAEHKLAVQSAFRVFDSPMHDENYLAPTPLLSSKSAQPQSFDTTVRDGSRFKPVRLHAKGGLGAVYLAKDGELGRTVALKEIQASHSLDQSSQDRFIAEAIVTGALEHPGIVPVYGLGRYRDGQPYYAMRFIRGMSLHDAIKDFHRNHPHKETQDYYSRPFKALVRNLIDLCSAMFYAHEHGILHRDIKPDNVMLGKYGETMVVDWGLAKVLGTDRPLTTTDHDNPALRALGGETMNGVVIGTPAFMSPEQAEGRNSDLTATSDIYSLGATLFSLLTGQRSVEGKTSREIVMNVRNGNIRRIESIAPHAPKALSSICYKAMSTARSNRYQTAGEMIEDIERWLADELVLAHKDSEKSLEKMGRLVRRYHTWAVAGAIFLTAFTLLAVLAVLLIDRARNRELVAKNQAQQSKAEAIQRYRESRSAIDTWLVGSNDALQFYPGTQSIRKRMLQLASDDYQRLAASPSRDPDLELERARALIRLGDIHQIQQQYHDARTQYQHALEVLGSIAAHSMEELRIAESANAHTRTGVSFFLEEKLTESKAEYAQAIRMLESLIESNPASAFAKNYLAVAFINLGELQSRSGNFDLAIRSFQTALDHYSQLKAATDKLSGANNESGHEFFGDNFGTEKASRERLLGEIRGRELLGRALLAIGKYTESDQVLELAINRLYEQQALSPDDPELADATASVAISRADVHRTQGRQTALEESLAEAIDQYKALATAMPDVPRFAENLALTLTDLGLAKQDHGLSIEANKILVEAQQQWQPLLEMYRDIPRFHEQAAVCEDALAQVVLDATNNATDAMAHATTAVQTYQELAELFPDEPKQRHRLAVSRSHAAIIQMALGNTDNALLLIDSAKAGLRGLIEAAPDVVAYRHSLAYVLNHEGTLHKEADKPDEAQSCFTESIQLWSKLAESGHADAANELATLLLTCPIIELRSNESALRFAKLAALPLSQNSRYKSLRAITLALNNDLLAAKQLLDEVRAEQGSWSGRDFFALTILSRGTGDGQADDWLKQGKQWMQANQPGNLNLKRLCELAM